MLPCFLLSAVVGSVVGALIFAFKMISSRIIKFSEKIYELVRENPIYLPLLLFGAVVVGLISALVLKYAKESRGGGIPTAVASIKGLIPLKWAQGIFVVFTTSLFTYLVGVPLGNEGPSVQMGTAVGKGSSELTFKKRGAYERYVMTGGACAGFGCATGAPISGIMFALEEAHSRFSPTIFIVAAISVLSGTATQDLLSLAFNVDTTFFDFVIHDVLPIKYTWVCALIGILCGLVAMAFTRFYGFVRIMRKNNVTRLPFVAKISLIFLVTAMLGFIGADFVGSGHSLIENIISRKSIWYVLIIALAIRALLMMFANVEGVTGGLFVPMLAFGAIISSVITELLIWIGAVDAEYYAIFIAVGMASFLAACARTPVTALTFAAEALCGTGNLLAVGIGVVLSYIMVEITGRTSFTDSVIEAKVEKEHKDRLPVIVNTHMSVMPGSFAVGMELREILWPPTCAVLSVDKKNSVVKKREAVMREGDLLHLHYQTYDPKETALVLTHILGVQEKDKHESVHFGSDDHLVPMD